MDEELDLKPGYQSCMITDETRQAACATDTPDQGCRLRIKQDRRDGHTGVYLGFERRGRLNSGEEQTMRLSSLKRWIPASSGANRQMAGPMVRTVTTRP